MIFRPGMAFAFRPSNGKKSIVALVFLRRRDTHTMDGDPLTLWMIAYVGGRGDVDTCEMTEDVLRYWTDPTRINHMQRIL